MEKIAIFFLTFISFNGFSQIYDDMDINESKVTPWIVNDKNEYEGVYFYGISEGESLVSLAIDGNIVDVQIENNGKEIYVDGEFSGWEKNIENYTNVKIIGNKFYSDQTKGEFVIYKSEDGDIKGLKLEFPPKELHKGKYEIGSRSRDNKLVYLSGNYPITKFDIVPLSELRSMEIDELIIMRNEIFARYGYIFKAGGDMAKYFEGQKWYSPEYKSVDKWITKIESENITNILTIEREKKSY